MSICRFQKQSDAASLVELDLEQYLAKLLTQTFRMKKSAQETQAMTRQRNVVSSLLAVVEENTFHRIFVFIMNKFVNTTIPHVSTTESRVIMDDLLNRGFHLLNTLNGTIGGFGTDLLVAGDAAQMYTAMKKLIDDDKKELIQLSVGRDSNEIWQNGFHRYLKSLVAIAKKGGIHVDAAPTKVVVGSSSMVANMQGLFAHAEV